jgi:arabinose-5-phosphate isomerase
MWNPSKWLMLSLGEAGRVAFRDLNTLKKPVEGCSKQAFIHSDFMPMTNKPEITSALRTLDILGKGLSALPGAFDGILADRFSEAVATIRAIKGRVIVTGVGKSGHIGSKIAATLASTGTPAYFVHSAEANHGDLGMIARDDVVLAMSWSGETAELKGTLAYAKRFAIPLIAITWNEYSALGKEADICLTLPKLEEACPNRLAPTTSTLLQLVMGDCLAIALLESRGFSATDFRTFHPGGSLGASLTHVFEIMHKGDEMPIVGVTASMEEAVNEISDKKFGCVAVVNSDGTLAGIITDGDLRRNFARPLATLCAKDIMTEKPATIAPASLASSAMALLNKRAITSLIVSEENRPVGMIHLHDLLRIGVA